jgi:hypothetical protein
MAALEQKQHAGSFIFKRFFEWYAPFFAAYSFVLARGQEYEADRCAAEMTSARQTAEMLLNLKLYGALLMEDFWPQFYQKAEQQQQPPDPYTEMQEAFKRERAPEQAHQWIAQALLAKTGTGDTHPSLADRLAALGQEPHPPAPVEETAAQVFFGKELGALTESLSRQWQGQVADDWRKRYEYAQEAQQRLRELDERAQTGELPLEEAWQRAYWTEGFRGREAALPLYQAILSAQPEHPAALYSVGRILLSQAEAAGIGPVEKAMQLDADYILPGCELVYGFLMAHGKEDEAQAYYQRAVRHSELLELARAERAQLGFKDSYGHHHLPAEQVAQLTDQLARYPEIAAAYLVRKEVRYFPDQPLYALGVAVRKPWYKYHSDKDDEKLLQQLTHGLIFPGETFVVILNHANQKMKKIMREIDGSQVYHR